LHVFPRLAFQAVGIDLKTKAWKVRNSWGTSWGEAGFIYLQYGSNMCEIAYLPTFTDAALV
jgi:aminopeptidase C